MNYEEMLADLHEALLDGEIELTQEETNKALEAGIDPMIIIQEGGTKAMEILGQRFQDGEAYLPELISGARAMQASLAVLLPVMKGEDSDQFQMGKVLMGTIVGDLHDIGKNIVSAMMSVHGFEIVDIGVDAPVKRFLQTAKENDAKIIGCSALLTTSMPYQRQLLQYAVDTGVRDQFYFIIGGGSVTPEWVKEIGADGWSRTAGGAAELCRKLIKSGTPPPLAEPILVDI